MDELTIDGKMYVSSKRAAAITGYAKDYIGQLCREGRVEAKLVGRSWYVYEPSLKKHRFSDDSASHQPKAVTAWGGESTDRSDKAEVVSEKANIQAVWDLPSYTPEEVKTLPEFSEPAEVETLPSPELQEEAVEPLSDMQSAWQEWFSARTEPVVPEPEEVRREEPQEETAPRYVSAPQNVPLRTIVSDIAPLQRTEEPVHRTYNPTQPVVALKKGKMPRQGRKSSKRMMQAVLIAVIALSASIALVSTGLIDSFHLGGTADIGFIQFFEGEQVIEK